MFSLILVPFIRLLLLCLLSLSFLGCQEEFHSQSQSIAGEYQISGIVSTTIGGTVLSQSLSGILTVVPGNTDSTWLLEEKTASTFNYPITLCGGSFVLQPFTDAMLTPTIRYNGTQSGTVTTDGYQITIDRHASADYYVMASSVGTTTVMAKCAKHVQLWAVKKK